jgi:hypothetical protein
MRSRHLFLAAFVATLAVAASAPSLARAAPCWKRVVTDWSKDGVINGHYSPRCLRQAIRKAPEDARDYSSIIDDINAALLDTLGRGATGPPGQTGPSNPSVGNGDATDSMGPTGPGSKSAAKARRAVPHAGTAASAPGHSRSLPLPLLVLAAVVLAAALAAGSPPLVKRLRARFPRVRPAADSVRPPA